MHIESGRIRFNHLGARFGIADFGVQDVVVYRLVTCATIEEAIYRKQV